MLGAQIRILYEERSIVMRDIDILWEIGRRKEGKGVRLVRAGEGRWFTVDNFYKIRVMLGLMRERGRVEGEGEGRGGVEGVAFGCSG